MRFLNWFLGNKNKIKAETYIETYEIDGNKKEEIKEVFELNGKKNEV